MRKISIFPLLAIIICAGTTLAQNRGMEVQTTTPKQRVALVIGNGAYASSPLKNPVNDARAMARTLRELNFDVIYQENLSLNDMKRSIRAFGEKAKTSNIRVFYYAGHGMQVNGENYLFPVDATFENEKEVEYEAVNAGFVLAQLDEAPNSLNIVILDACRNNPFARSFRSATRGLAAITAPGGTLIAYATSPGSEASDGDSGNGLYTQELLRFMRMPEVGVEEVFKRVRISVREKSLGKQTPWESSSLMADFYFISAPSAQGSASNSSNSGTDYSNTSDDQTSIQRLHDAIKLNRTSSKAYYDLGLIFIQQQRWDEALFNFQQALQGDLKPRWVEAWAHVKLGNVYDALGNRTSAVQQYKAAVEAGSDPDVNSPEAVEEAKNFLATPFDPNPP